LLLSCGGGSSGGSGNSDSKSANLIIMAPNQISSSLSGNLGYITIMNPSSAAITGISYTIYNTFGSGNNVSINSSSASSCSTVAAKSMCILKVNIPAEIVAGSFRIAATNSNAAGSASYSYPIGIGQARYSNEVNADGITLQYYHKIIAGTQYLVVSGIVTSESAGTFNNVVLVNNTNVPLLGQQVISGNLGAGAPNLSQGNDFAILLEAPGGLNATQTLKVKTEEVAADGTVSNEHVSNKSSTLVTTIGRGIANLLPNAIYLSADNPEQVLTISNTGVVPIRIQQLVADSSNVGITFTSTVVPVNGVITATFTLIDTAVDAASGNFNLTYDNGLETIEEVGVVDQNVDPAIIIPPPSSSESAIYGMIGVLYPDDNFFTTTNVGMVTRQLTLTNSGNTPENNITLALPANFTISAGDSNSCTVTQGTSPAAIADNLAESGGSCNVTVVYTNTTATIQNSDSISISYDYAGGMPSPVPTMVGVNYQVTQSTANLSVLPRSPQVYTSIVNDNSAVSAAIMYLVGNSGDAPATNIAFSFTGNDSGLFSPIEGGSCVSGGEIAIDGTCTVNTQFGPASNGTATGTKAAAFNVNYIPYSEGAVETTNGVTVIGSVTQAPSATYISNISANTFNSGDGSLNTPFQGYTDTTYTLTISYTNNSDVLATHFTTTTNPVLPSGWSQTSHGCYNVTMAAGGQCFDVYTLNSNNAATIDLNLGSIVTASWLDSSGEYVNQMVAGVSMVYTSLIVPSTITIVTTPEPLSGIMMGDTFYFTATISGSVSSTVTAAFANPATGIITSDPSPCNLDPVGAASCIFTVSTAWDNSLTNASNLTYQILLTATNGAAIYGGTSLNYGMITPTIYLAQTGQTSTSPVNPAPDGSDGAVQSGITFPSPRFTIGTGVESMCITDNLTGLMWSRVPLTNRIQWGRALSVANDLVRCGYDDWRIPNINELSSLMNYSQTRMNGWLNSQGFSGIQDEYWTSTIGDSTLNTAWDISMYYSMTILTGVSSDALYGALPVRGTSTSIAKTGQTSSSPYNPAPVGSDGNLQMGESWPNPRFVAGSGAASDCITDNLTGLMWKKNLTYNTYTWYNALDYANNLNLCGYNDWRIPNINEFRSIINYGFTSQVSWLNSQGFHNVTDDLYWTSTTYALSTGSAFELDLYQIGAPYPDSKGYDTYIIPVRGGN
ncbi:MAG: DUF1566 domain-containing protein, partial [Burkholderiales bacterium]|nr:DUF1566 domain-containing protein [Burkholderiales bacterium]